MPLAPALLDKLCRDSGESLYVLDSDQFKQNYRELQRAFRNIYPNSHIAYSYKTNYTPSVCKLVDSLGGYAEVVSGMEVDIAWRCGISSTKVFLNGPYKDSEAVEKVLIGGGVVNLDCAEELQIVRRISEKHPDSELRLGIRCNFDIKDGITSRFGLDAENGEIQAVINSIRNMRNVTLAGLHCHFASRSLDTWPARVSGLLNLVRQTFGFPPYFISLGGGLFGKMGDSLKSQFASRVPEYSDYAAVAATAVRDFYSSAPQEQRPRLIIEPGTALVGDVMKFVARVVSIKEVRGKSIATLSGSVYNINPTLNGKNLPVTIIHPENSANEQKHFHAIDFGGYTCIESDYLYKGFRGKLAVGDLAVFENAGSYSVVLKPPFIMPCPPIVEYSESTSTLREIRRKETFEDVFKTYQF